jgi:hypothetical protein
MKEKIAVATVSGKAYFLLVDELKRKNMPFLNLIPGDPVPIEVRVVITTEREKHLINHERILVYDVGREPETVINEALKIVHGKESCEKVVIGIDPGEVFGLAVLADGNIIKTENCFSIEETLQKIRNVIKNFSPSPSSVSVKIGDGVPTYRNRLLEVLDEALPSNVTLEIVSEAGTNRHLNETKHRRGLRDIVSAIRIAGRVGHIFPRGKRDESDN